MAKKTTAKQKPDFNEVTAAGGTVMGNAFSDKTMEANPQNIKTWRGFFNDHQVTSTWQQRKLSVMAVDYEVVPGGDDQVDIAAADDLREQLAKVNFNRSFRKMHYGKYYGFSIAECMWTVDGNRIALGKIKVRPPESFRFDAKTGELKFVGGGNIQGEPLPENKMWLFTVDGDSDGAPHGPPIGWQLYWPMFLKENGAQFWAVAVEKYGMPTAAGTFPLGSSPEAQANFLESLLAIHGQAAVAFPEGFEAKLIEAVRTSGGDYLEFLSYWDRAISKIIVGQTMTTDDGSSKSQAQVHKGILDVIVQADADDLCDSFNEGPVQWLTGWNFPNAKFPKVQRRIKKAEDLGEKATRDKTLAEAAGGELTHEYVKEKYDVDLMERTPAPANDDTVEHATGLARDEASFTHTFADPDDITVLANQLDDVTAEEVDAMIDEVRRILNTSQTPAEFAERLLTFTNDQDNADLAKLVAGGAAVAAMMGQAEAEDA